MAQTSVLSNGEIDSLVNISKLQDYHTMLPWKLSANSLAHEYFLLCDWFGAVFDLSRWEEQSIQLKSAAALRDLSSNQDFEIVFADMGGIRTMIDYHPFPILT